MTRVLWVWLHRWAGLAMAGFLIVVGLTGSLLAFWLEINQWLTPELYPGDRAGIELDAATLARRAEALVPLARATTVYLGYPGSVMIGMEARDGAPPLDFEFIHLDPIDGHELGPRDMAWTAQTQERHHAVRLRSAHVSRDERDRRLDSRRRRAGLDDRLLRRLLSDAASAKRTLAQGLLWRAGSRHGW